MLFCITRLKSFVRLRKKSNDKGLHVIFIMATTNTFIIDNISRFSNVFPLLLCSLACFSPRDLPADLVTVVARALLSQSYFLII